MLYFIYKIKKEGYKMKTYKIIFTNGFNKIQQLTERQAERLATVGTVATITEIYLINGGYHEKIKYIKK